MFFGTIIVIDIFLNILDHFSLSTGNLGRHFIVARLPIHLLRLHLFQKLQTGSANCGSTPIWRNQKFAFGKRL